MKTKGRRDETSRAKKKEEENEQRYKRWSAEDWLLFHWDKKKNVSLPVCLLPPSSLGGGRGWGESHCRPMMDGFSVKEGPSMKSCNFVNARLFQLSQKTTELSAAERKKKKERDPAVRERLLKQRQIPAVTLPSFIRPALLQSLLPPLNGWADRYMEGWNPAAFNQSLSEIQREATGKAEWSWWTFNFKAMSVMTVNKGERGGWGHGTQISCFFNYKIYNQAEQTRHHSEHVIGWP